MARSDPSLARIYADIGDLLCRLERYTEADAAFRQAARRDSVVARGLPDLRKPVDVRVLAVLPGEQESAVVLLRNARRYLRIPVSLDEAIPVTESLEGYGPERPVTHDLLRNVLAAVGTPLAQAGIISHADGVYKACLMLANGKEVAARPSDAITLALVAQAPIFVTGWILDNAGVEIEEEIPQIPARPAPGPVAAPDPPVTGTIQLEVIGPRLAMPSRELFIAVKERSGNRSLVIQVDVLAALTIKAIQHGEDFSRLLTYGLFRDALAAAGIHLVDATIDSRRDGAFFASLHLSGGETVAASPADAIVLSLMTGAPFLAAADIVASS